MQPFSLTNDSAVELIEIKEINAVKTINALTKKLQKLLQKAS